ncbi:MAG: ABC transporter substrate-binding protein [Candidatus Humimicrobiaceae bacterium]
MKRKWMLFVAMLVVVVMVFSLGLAGCKATAIETTAAATTTETTTSSTAEATSAPTETTAPLKPVTITYESWSPTKDTMDIIIQGFKKVHPEITVEVKLHANFTEFATALKTAAAIGETPDVFQFDTPQTLNLFKDLIEPLDTYAARDWGDSWKDKFITSAITDMSLDGKVMGMPGPLSPAGTIWYNKTMLDKYGIAEPKTYADLKTAAEILRKNKISPMVLGCKDSWAVIDHFQTILNDVAPGKQYDAFAKRIKFTDPDIEKAFDVWKQFFDDKIFQNDAFSMTQYMDGYNAFIKDQTAAMWSNGAWNLDMYNNKDLKAQVDSVDWGVMAMPDLNGDGKNAPLMGTFSGTCISKDSKNKDAAFELVKYMTVGEGLTVALNTWLGMSPTIEKRDITVQLSANAKQNRDKIGELSTTLGIVRRGIENTKVTDKLYDVLSRVAYGKLASQAAAEEVQAEIDAN